LPLDELEPCFPIWAYGQLHRLGINLWTRWQTRTSAKRETYRRNANEFKTPSDETAARCGIFAEQKERAGILALVDLLGCGRPAKTRQRPARRVPEAGDGEILGCCCCSSNG
jgi:hypothetical protein